MVRIMPELHLEMQNKGHMLGNPTAHLLDDLVVGQRNPLLVELSITSLLDQLPHALQVQVPTNIMIRSI